jgi:hypothetical protein
MEETFPDKEILKKLTREKNNLTFYIKEFSKKLIKEEKNLTFYTTINKVKTLNKP